MIKKCILKKSFLVSDTFTDTAITKQNGVADKELRELTPWEPEESETQGGGGLHDGGGASVSNLYILSICSLYWFVYSSHGSMGTVLLNQVSVLN